MKLVRGDSGHYEHESFVEEVLLVQSASRSTSSSSIQGSTSWSTERPPARTGWR